MTKKLQKRKPHEVVTVEFYEHQIEAIWDGEDAWIVMKRMCENLGVGSHTQLKKIQENEAFDGFHTLIRLETSKGPRGAFCLHLEALALWLGTIQTKRIKNDKVRKNLVKYQRECMSALNAYFSKKTRQPSVDLPMQTEEQIDELIKERFGRLYVRRKPKAYKPVYTKEQLKQLAIMCGHPEWYNEETGLPVGGLPHMLSELTSRKMPEPLMEAMKDNNPRVPSGGRKARFQQMFKGEAEHLWLTLAQWTKMLGDYESYKELKAVWDYIHPDAEQDRRQLSLFRPVLRLLPVE